MTLLGYGGSILYVDLSRGEIRKEPLDTELANDYIGGWGINNRLAYDLVRPDVDPLSAENFIFLGAGVFSGTLIPGSAELAVTTKFPINGAFATGSGGGHMPYMLKTSGYDNVAITGRAEKPCYLKILDDNVELCDASDLWGMDCAETIDILRRRHDPCSIIPIGPAGENLVRISVCQTDRLGTVGSGGLAAVMGSKNLKAIVACEGTKGVEIADRKEFLRIVDVLLERMVKWPGRERVLQSGLTGELLTPGGPVGMGSRKNFTCAVIPDAGEDPRVEMFERHLNVRSPIACAGCPMADKERISLPDGKYANLLSYTTHILVSGKWGVRSWTEAYDTAVMRNDIANRYGIDLLLFDRMYSFLAYLCDLGIIGKEDTDGIELNGEMEDDLDTYLKLLKMTAHREGFGDAIADGILEAARRIGKGAENHAIPVQVKGRTMVTDARGIGLGTMQLTQVLDPRGAHVGAGGGIAYFPGRPPSDFVRHGDRLGVPDEAVERIVTSDSVNVGRWLRYSHDMFSLFDCLGMCMRAPIARFYHVNTFAELYTALTGIPTSAPELMKVGERCWNLHKALNVRAGSKEEDLRPPKMWFTPLKGPKGEEYPLMDYYGTRALTEEDVDGLIEDYYDERGWDPKTGIPTKEKLVELKLEDIAEDLSGSGRL